MWDVPFPAGIRGKRGSRSPASFGGGLTDEIEVLCADPAVDAATGHLARDAIELTGAAEDDEMVRAWVEVTRNVN